jgi:hypothetical protein
VQPQLILGEQRLGQLLVLRRGFAREWSGAEAAA